MIMAFLLTYIPFPAFAAGKMTVDHENFHVTDGYSVYGYAFAKVENKGDKPAAFSAGLLEIYDANGDTLTSTDYLHCYPPYLKPGEIGYIYCYDNIENADTYTVVDDYLLTVTGKSTNSEVVYFPAIGHYQPNVQISKYSTYDYITAEITNDSAETIFDVEVVLVLLDDSDNILLVEHQNFYSTGINPGSTITFRSSISSTWYDTWAREGVTPTHVDVIAYKD